MATYAVRYRLRTAPVSSHRPSVGQVRTYVAVLHGTIDTVARQIHSLRDDSGKLAYRACTINLIDGTDADWDRQVHRDIASGRCIPWLAPSWVRAQNA